LKKKNTEIHPKKKPSDKALGEGGGPGKGKADWRGIGKKPQIL